MSKIILKKYRITSTRLQNWDYGWNAPYFVTVCTHYRERYFGKIVGTQNISSPQIMILSEIGKIAHQYWIEIPNHFPFVKLGEFVVMPDHVHGIVIIDKKGIETPKLGVSIPSPPTTNPASKWTPGILGVIINQYKRICTINARKIQSDFAWQSRFYDHIIRNDESLQRISKYIVDNPLKWKEGNLQ